MEVSTARCNFMLLYRSLKDAKLFFCCAKLKLLESGITSRLDFFCAPKGGGILYEKDDLDQNCVCLGGEKNIILLCSTCIQEI